MQGSQKAVLDEHLVYSGSPVAWIAGTATPKEVVEIHEPHQTTGQFQPQLHEGTPQEPFWTTSAMYISIIIKQLG